MWKPFKTGVNTAIKKEEYDDQTSIELISPGYYTNYEILCDCYDLILHTVFADTINEATAKYEQIKAELKEIADVKDEDKRNDMIYDFLERW